jgi:hypothetical protein
MWLNAVFCPSDSRRLSWGVGICAGVVVLLFCGCALMILNDLYREAEIDHALAEIQRVGGLYRRDESGRSRPVTGIDLDSTVLLDTGDVRVRGPATDETLLLVARFDRLQELSLDGARVTDAGLASVKGLKELRRLNLAHTAVTDVGLNSLKELANLSFIDLRGTKVTQPGVRELQHALPTAKVLTDDSERQY